VAYLQSSSIQNAASRAETSPLLPDEVLSDYLDHLCASLVGIVPFRARDRFREEIAFDLESRVARHVREGIEPREAVRMAIEKVGRSEEVSARYLSEWVRYQPVSPLARRIGLPNAYAILFFGQASLWGLALVLYRVYSPNPQPYTFGLPLEKIRSIIPAPLPLPDSNPSFWILLLYTLLAPIVAGILLGRKAPIGAAAAAFQVQLMLTLVSYTVGAMMLPYSEGTFFALAQLLYWVGVGVGTAHLTSVISRRRLMRFRLEPSVQRKPRK
jgi:hypothetical protein